MGNITTALLLVFLYSVIRCRGDEGLKCGDVPAEKSRQTLNTLTRIVGGIKSRRGLQPWQVSLKFQNNHICGGSIIHGQWILTAAHCVTDIESYETHHLIVTAGEFSLHEVDEEEQNIPVEKIILHPDYETVYYNCDAALLYLKYPITLGTMVQPICLPHKEEIFEPKTLCVTSGWGRTSENGYLSPELQEVYLPIIADKVCSDILATFLSSSQVRKNICAGFPEGGKDACQGDSGGPLVCRRPSGLKFLVGITSLGVGCARAWGGSEKQSGSPAVFTKVTDILEFILQYISDDDSSGSEGACSDSGILVIGKTGKIQYPKPRGTNYINNRLCKWIIEVPQGQNILIEFLYMDIEFHVTCDHDYLAVYSSKGRLLSKMCGTTLPSALLVKSSQASVKFVSDSSESGLGFYLNFTAVTSVAASGCGSIAVLQKEGTIDSENFPDDKYPSNMNCSWLIMAPDGHRIQLIFEDFELEPSEGCIYDFIAFYNDSEQSSIIVKHCGLYIPPNVQSLSNTMLVHFESDKENNFRGFKAKFSFIPSAEIEEKVLPSPEIHLAPRVVPDDVCGVAPIPAVWLANRIEREEAFAHSWPWHVGLYYGNDYVCGGAVIDAEWILTAAHCFNRFKNLLLWIAVAGDHDRMLEENTEQTVKVRSIVLHEQFDHVTLDYDVALLRLQAPLNFNDYVRPVCLPELLNTLNPTKVCVATKWGSTKEGDVRVNRLQQTIAPVLNTSICERDFYSDHPGGITDQMVCAGLPTPDGRDSCQGDSGGPLVCMDDRNSGTFRIYGIASWGAGCFRPKKPGVYTRVRVIMNWILEEIEKRDSTNILVVSTPELLKRCAGVKLTKARGEIKSPGYPRKYPNNARCTWTIEAVEDSVIRLDFKTFRTEKTEVCIDHLFVYATQNNIQELTAHYCGETLPSSLKVVGSRVTLVFTSNDQVTFEGFWLTYHIHLPEFGSDGLLDNKRACQPFTLLRVGAGEIFSASYPDMYPVMLECVWTLYSVSGKRVQIEIEDFSTESVSGCTWDYLKIFDGASRTATLLGHFCGEKEPLSLWSSGSFLTLYFKTDGSVGSRGFRLIYNEISSKSTGSLITHLEPSMENENKIQYGVPQIQPHGIETDEQNGQVSVRIIGGKSTVPHSWPWLVSLQSRKGHYCCGSLISKFWVVTAAHCPLSYGDVVILGLNNLHSAVENRQAIAVGGIYPHKEYKGVHNDIMLVQLQYAAILDDTVIPVALPHPSEEMDLNASCVIAGWGFTNVYNRTLAPKLQQAVVCLMDLDSCQSFWGDINESVVCTKAAAASSCMGDSGGALVCRKNGVYYLTGIISRGLRSCLVDAPTVNTNVAYYRTWISSITEGSV